MSAWTWITPAVSLALLAGAVAVGAGPAMVAVCTVALVASVLAAVHHAEVVAHRVGEPYGTLILAVAVTVIEASLILSMLFAGGPGAAQIPRDAIYAAVMIIANGVVGACLLVGAIKHREQSFRAEGSDAGLAALIAMAALTLVLPAFTTSTPGGTYGSAQLLFAAVSSLTLWCVYLFMQTVRHRDYFLPAVESAAHDTHAEPPTKRAAWVSFGLLLACLVSVVGLAKVLSPTIEGLVIGAGLPNAVIGIVIAMVVLLPETWAALRAAQRNRIQTSMNLAIGSALACIGLTIPVVAFAAVAFDKPLTLGLESKDLVLLAVTFLVSSVTLTGRTHMMQGAVHLVLFAAYLFLAFVP